MSKFLDELIYDREFNNTLDEISKSIMENIILQTIKDKMNESINKKVNNLYNKIELCKEKITEILNKKLITDYPEEMKIINELIMNYTEIVNNQNNHYLLKISEKPFNLLYDLVHNHLEPPLELIKEKYNTIEERLLNEIIRIIETFPDNYLLVKEKLELELIANNISLGINDTNDLFKEYQTIFYEDFLSYINKLVHYTYINGTYTYDTPCNYSFCLLNFNNSNGTNERRRLNNNNKTINFNFIKKPNKNGNDKFINKKTRKLERYDHTMGPVTRDDVIYFLLDIETTLYNFNKTYLSKEYKEINKISNLYFNKINSTYLIKLKKSIDMISVKNEILVYNIYKQYNDIAFYINKYSDLIEAIKKDFINLLSDSSLLLERTFNISFNTVYKVYETFFNLIESKMEYIDKKYINKNKNRLLDKKDDEITDDEDDKPGGPPSFQDKEQEKNAKELFDELFGSSKNEAEGSIKEMNFMEKLEDFMKKHDIEIGTSIRMDLVSFTKVAGMNIGTSICKKFKPEIRSYNYILGSFSYVELAFLIKPVLEAGICIDLGFEISWNEKDYSFYIDVYGMGEISISFEIGAYVQSTKSPIQLSLSLGIKGVMGSGRAGIKLSLFIGQDRYDTKVYLELEASRFSFYILLKFSIDIKIYSFSFEFYIFNKAFAGLKFETYSIAVRYYNNTRRKTLEGGRYFWPFESPEKVL